MEVRGERMRLSLLLLQAISAYTITGDLKGAALYLLLARR
jgi:hypothetical protein